MFTLGEEGERSLFMGNRAAPKTRSNSTNRATNLHPKTFAFFSVSAIRGLGWLFTHSKIPQRDNPLQRKANRKDNKHMSSREIFTNTSSRERFPFDSEQPLKNSFHINHFYKWKANAITS
jgi:nitrate reductase alpha subunit